MTRLVVRSDSRASRATAPLSTVMFVGLASGAIAGFVLGELFGPATRRALRPAPHGARSVTQLVLDAEDALAADEALASHGLSVIPVGRRAVELHGWVADRGQRARAQRVVARTVGNSIVVNCLLVRGEDDALAPDLDVMSA